MKTRTIIAACAIAAGSLLALTACSSEAPQIEGAWGDPDEQASPSLEFTEKGEYSGTDGCNSVGGSYTVEGEKIDLGLMRSTLMYCEGVDTWLSQARTAELSGDTLTMFDEDGEEIGTLSRHEG